MVYLLDVVVGAGAEGFGGVVDDGHITEGACEEEVCEGLPCEAFAHALADNCRVGRALLEAVVDGVGMADDSPEGVGHVLEVLVVAVDGEVEVGAASPVVVS